MLGKQKEGSVRIAKLYEGSFRFAELYKGIRFAKL